MKLLMVLFAAIAILLAPAAQALEGKIINLKVETKNVAGPVDVAVYLPAGYDAKRAQAYPLIIQLHGGGGSSAAMTGMAETLEAGIKAGLVPASVSVMPSAGRSFYMDYRDGSQKWETFVVADLLAWMRLQRAQGTRGHAYHRHIDGRDGIAAHRLQAPGQVPGRRQHGAGHRARTGLQGRKATRPLLARRCAAAVDLR
jgi:S-formylglutathione hydrolase FrmB